MSKRQLLWAVVVVAMNTAIFCIPATKAQPAPKPVAPPPVRPEPPASPELPEFTAVPVYRKVSDSGTVYADVLSHVKGSAFGDRAGRSTNVHETAHGIHSELRNELIRKLSRRVNAMYFLDGRAVVVDEPGLKKSAAKKYVPVGLRSYRWDLYMEGQSDWDDTPLYICDEWAAYILGGKCSLEDRKNGKFTESWTDAVSGCLEFSIYATGLAMAVRDMDKEYWRDNRQFRRFMAYALKESEDLFMAGREMKEFRWEKQDKQLLELLTSPQAEPMRRFLKEEMGGAWLSVDPKKIKSIVYEDFQKESQAK